MLDEVINSQPIVPRGMTYGVNLSFKALPIGEGARRAGGAEKEKIKRRIQK